MEETLQDASKAQAAFTHAQQQ